MRDSASDVPEHFDQSNLRLGNSIKAATKEVGSHGHPFSKPNFWMRMSAILISDEIDCLSIQIGARGQTRPGQNVATAG
jgi:hypothetical protein